MKVTRNPISSDDVLDLTFLLLLGATEIEREQFEIWDVRRGWIAKWSVEGTEGGITGQTTYNLDCFLFIVEFILVDFTFLDSHTLWSHNLSGSFSQIDLSRSSKPLDEIQRSAIAWDGTGRLAFVSDKPQSFELPYDDM